MKLIILKNNLLEGLFSVEKSVGENTSLPILKNILFSAENNKIKITATNLDLAVIYNLSGKIIEEGKICIPFSLFYNIVKNLNSERIQLEQQKNYHLNIKTDNYEATIYGQNPEDFPIIPTINTKEPNLVFKSKSFKEFVSKVIIAAQYSEIRPEISGLFIYYQNNILKFVATDSFRLAEKILPLESYRVTKKTEKIKAIIPLKTVFELLRIIKDNDSEIELFIDPHQVLFRTEYQDIISRIIDSEFPDYEVIIPKEVKFEVIVNRQEMINSIRLTSIFTSRANDVTLRVGDNKKFLEVFATESQLGENRYLVPAKLKGEKFSIVFNWRYLLDGLKIFDSDEIFLGINSADDNKPSLIKTLEDKSFIYILMPLKS